MMFTYSVNVPHDLCWRRSIDLVVLTRKQPQGRDTDTDAGNERRADDLSPYDSFFGRSEPTDRSRDEPRYDGLTGERIRRRLGLSGRQWTWLVSIALFIPYPIFVSLGVIYGIEDRIFIPVTLVFSAILIASSFYL